MGPVIDCGDRGHRKAWDAAGRTDINSRGSKGLAVESWSAVGLAGDRKCPIIFNLAFSLGLTLTVSGILMACLNSLV